MEFFHDFQMIAGKVAVAVKELKIIAREEAAQTILASAENLGNETFGKTGSQTLGIRCS